MVPLWQRVLKWEAGIPEPLSDTKILFVPPSTISSRTKEQPLSKLLSMSSLTMSVNDGIDIFDIIILSYQN